MSSWYRALLALAVVLTSVASGAGPAGARDRLYINTGVGAPYVREDRQGFLDLLVAEIFRRLGREAEIAFYPSAERALINANGGIDDGDALRVAGLETIYPNLVRVPETIIENRFVGYSIRHDVAMTSVEALRPHQVGYIVGWKIFESKLAEGYQTTTVQNAEQLFTLLANDRADIVLFEEWQGLAVAKRLGLDVKVLTPPLARTDMFMYLHVKHADLVAPAAEALRAIKADGTYQALRERALFPLLPNGGAPQ